MSDELEKKLCLTIKYTIMKKNLLLIVCALSLSSCGTLFTSSKQSLTFMGLPETKIYDNSQKLGEISEDGTATIRVKKSLTSKTLLAKKRIQTHPNYTSTHV